MNPSSDFTQCDRALRSTAYLWSEGTLISINLALIFLSSLQALTFEAFRLFPMLFELGLQKRLSYREVEYAYSYIDKLKDSQGVCLVPDLERRIPLSRIARAYGYENSDAVPGSPLWKASARTPITPYEVFNHLTEIGSHYTHIPEKERLNVLIHAGQLMFKESWDLEELAPQEVDFSAWRAEAIQIIQ